uniref:C3H1-type domain-containing protein n=1 Tax=Aegilops tauschii subsp. strangulata TaxID=200361 RepID=A0A453T7R1_AEGTS
YHGSPAPHYHGHQRHPDEEIRRAAGHHHQHNPQHHHQQHQQPQHHHQQQQHHHHHQQQHQQPPWEDPEERRRRFAPAHQEPEEDRRRYAPAHQEPEDDRRRYTPAHQETGEDRRRYAPAHQEPEDDRRRYTSPHQLRLSPPPSPRKKQRCALHDRVDIESTSSSGPPPSRHQRQQPHASYAAVDSFADRAPAHPGYSHESFSTHSDSKGSRKIQMVSQTSTLSGERGSPRSPRATIVAHPRRTPQKEPAPRRLSVWQRIEEGPAAATRPPPPPPPKALHISPAKSSTAGSASKGLASVISVDCKAKSAGSNEGDSTKVIQKDAGKNVRKVLSSVLVKPSPESKEKEGDVEKLPGKHVQENVSGSPSESLGLAGRPVAGVKKVKKIVIKKIVRRIVGKDKQISSEIVSEKRDNIDAIANASEKEEGEIITSSLEKDTVSEHNMVSTSGTAGAGNGVNVQKGENSNSINPRKRKATSAIESKKILDSTNRSGSKHLGKEENRSSMGRGDIIAASAIKSTEALATRRSEHPGKGDRSSMDSGVRSATLVSTYDNYQEEGEIMSLSGETSAAVASNPLRISHRRTESSMKESKAPKNVSKKNTVCTNGVTVNHDTAEISGGEDARREDNDILINTSEEDVRRVSSTPELTICKRKGAQKGEGMILTGLGENSIGNVSVAHHVKVSNTRELDVNEDTRTKESQIPIELCQTNTSKTIHLLEAPNTSETTMSKFVMGSTERHATTTCNSGSTPEFNLAGGFGNSHKEDLLNDGTAFNETDAPMEVEGRDFFNLSCSRNVESMNVPPLDADLMEDLTRGIVLNNGIERGATAQVAELINLHRGHLPPEIDFPLAHSRESSSVSGNSEQSVPTTLTLGSNFYFSNNIESERQLKENNELLEGQKGLDVSTVTEFDSLVKQKGVADDDSVGVGSQNWLTLPPAVNSIAMSEQFVTNDATVRKDRIGLDQSVDNDTSVSQDHDTAQGLEQCGSVDAFSSQVNSIRLSVSGSDMPQSDSLTPEISGNVEKHGEIILSGLHSISSINVVDQHDHQMVDISVGNPTEPAIIPAVESIDVMDAELVSPQVSVELDNTYDSNKGISGDVEKHVEVVLSGLHSISSINVVDQHDHQMVDNPVGNPIEPAIPAVESTDVMDTTLSPQVSVEPDNNTYNSNTEGSVVNSSTKRDLLSSWIESVVSEAKKDHQPCKSTLPSISLPVLAPKEDSRRAGLDSVGNPVGKSPQMNCTSSMPPKVAPKQANLPSSSREPPRVSSNPRHKTWYRGDLTSSTSLPSSQPSGLPPKQPPRRNDKTQNSYIRKGNALIRNPATGKLSHSSSLDTQNKLNKPVIRRSMNFVRKVDSNDSAARSNFTVERPKTPPLPLHAKSINSTTNLPEQLSKTLPKQHVPETEKEDSAKQLNSGVDTPSIRSAQTPEPSDASKVVYVRPKSNQLVAAQRQHPDDPTKSSTDKVLSLQPPTASDLYFKKRKNQIVLSSSSSDGQNTKEIATAESLNSGENNVQVASSNNSINGLKERPHKALRTNNMGTSSHVWTLSGQQPQRKGSVGTSYAKAFPRILPWKRKIYYKNFRSSHTQNVSSLRIVRKLLQTKKRDMIYTVSTNGFSIRKSGVLSVGGSSLKWSRSLEKRSQKVNEEATLAVADVEKKRGEKRKRQYLHYTGRNDQYSLSVAGNQLRNNNQASSDLRRYVRVSKGNQLVRNPKKVTRMLANEKVRWSLHTVRSRLAKKRQYCQFFTRFGECKKPKGECRYIHDPAKVTICTKFLKGLCSDTSCKLTHKVLPERMQDCSYFLKGLCTNTACPYRHVKVNSKAPACEDFLKGYCADGDEVLNDTTEIFQSYSSITIARGWNSALSSKADS